MKTIRNRILREGGFTYYKMERWAAGECYNNFLLVSPHEMRDRQAVARRVRHARHELAEVVAFYRQLGAT